MKTEAQKKLEDWTWDDVCEHEVGFIYRDGYENGVRVLVMRGPSALCAYLGVPKGHPLWGHDYDSVPIYVHGGLTFADEGDGEMRPAEVWWYGWDYAHLGDESTYDKKDPTAHHEPACLWRRAVEWRNGCTTVPYGDKTILASRVCICEHLNTEHDFDNPIQACEVCDCTGFIVGGKRVSP